MSKELLELKEKLIKNTNKRFKLSKFFIIMCIFLIILYSYICYDNFISEDKYFILIMNFICLLLWIFNLYMNIKVFKKAKKDIKEYTIDYNNDLKKFDHPKYLRTQRIAKLNKLNKRKLFQ